MSALFNPPRWPGGPPMCAKVNLPAFETEALLLAFLMRNGPRCSVEEIYQCPFCDLWHANTTAPDPTGSSSGTGRSHK